MTGDGVLSVDDIRGRYTARMHPDVRAGKRTEDEVLTEFLETFEQHHNTMSEQKADGVVTPEEFLEYYAHVSMNIDSDAYFEAMMSSAWRVSDPDAQPYAGSRRKVTNVNARDAYRNDHHRNLFGTDNRTPFEKKPQTEWATTTAGSYHESALAGQVPAAGGGNLARSGAHDPRMQFADNSQRMTPAQYRGI